MKVRAWFAIVFTLAAALPCRAGEVLSSLHEVHLLTDARARLHLPVTFEATVTYYRNGDTDLFVQEGAEGVYISFKAGAGLRPGDRVRVTGTTDESFRPMVYAEAVTLLRHGSLPPAVVSGFDALRRAQLDCRRVSLRAVVRSADLLGTGPQQEIYLQTVVPGGTVDVAVDSIDPAPFRGLVGAEVEITGVATAKFDEGMQLTGARINVAGPSDIRMVRKPAVRPEQLPFTPMNEVYSGYRVTDHSQRVRVHGAVTYYRPGSTLVIQDGAQSLWVRTLTSQTLALGEVVDVSGFPEVHNDYPTLSMAKVERTGRRENIAPSPLTWDQLVLGGHAFRVVSTEGRLVRQVHLPTGDEYLLETQGHLFSAIYRDDDPAGNRPVRGAVPEGTMVRVRGIGMFNTADPFNGPVASEILLRSDDDLTVIAPPGWLNVEHLLMLAGILLAVLVAAGVRGWALEFRMRQEAALAVTLGRLRSSVLEDLHRGRPIGEVMVKILDLLSLQLKGATCWCVLEDGMTLGQVREPREGLKILHGPIPSPAGRPLGTIFAAVSTRTRLEHHGAEALFRATQLTALAIETSGLHADLVYRSEFDPLTDLHNRYAFTRRVDLLIENGTYQAGLFGLIYIDLDHFKQVNDRFGHAVGDLYLREVARRMKRVVRPGDMLARLGGDEFAVVVPLIHGRDDTEDIRQRLQRCFDDPLTIEGHVLRGSASMGLAVYPEDGATQDALLRAADAAMYGAKRSSGLTIVR